MLTEGPLYPRFIDEEAKAQRGQVTLPRSPSLSLEAPKLLSPDSTMTLKATSVSPGGTGATRLASCPLPAGRAAVSLRPRTPLPRPLLPGLFASCGICTVCPGLSAGGRKTPKGASLPWPGSWACQGLAGHRTPFRWRRPPPIASNAPRQVPFVPSREWRPSLLIQLTCHRVRSTRRHPIVNCLPHRVLEPVQSRVSGAPGGSVS